MNLLGCLCVKLPSESQLLTKLTEHIYPLGQELSMTHLWIPQAMPSGQHNQTVPIRLGPGIFFLFHFFNCPCYFAHLQSSLQYINQSQRKYFSPKSWQRTILRVFLLFMFLFVHIIINGNVSFKMLLANLSSLLNKTLFYGKDLLSIAMLVQCIIPYVILDTYCSDQWI